MQPMELKANNEADVERNQVPWVPETPQQSPQAGGYRAVELWGHWADSIEGRQQTDLVHQEDPCQPLNYLQIVLRRCFTVLRGLIG